MKKVVRYIVILCFYALVYMVLVENFGWLNFGIGLAVSFIAFAFSSKYLLHEQYEKLFPIRLFGFIVYIIYLLGKIMVSGVNAAVLTITGEVKLQYEWYESKLNNDFALNLLANSITLTPGTVTVNRKNNELLVMQLCKENEEFDSTDIDKFQNKILKIVVRESE